MFGGHLWRRQLELLKRIDDDLRNYQSRVLLVIRGNDVPRRMSCARRFNALLICLGVFRPVLSLANVGGAELPVLDWIFDPLDESFSLLLLRQVEEKLYYPRPVSLQMRLR